MRMVWIKVGGCSNNLGKSLDLVVYSRGLRLLVWHFSVCCITISSISMRSTRQVINPAGPLLPQLGQAHDSAADVRVSLYLGMQVAVYREL